MASVGPVALGTLEPHVFAQWSPVFALQQGSQRELWMVASCRPGAAGAVHAVWMANVALGWAWPVAQPSVRGNLVEDMGFVVPPGAPGAYSLFGRRWVRAMFLPRLLAHVPGCGARRVEGSVSEAFSTVGALDFGGAAYAVEWHPGEVSPYPGDIWVMDGAGSVAAMMRMGPHMVLGPAVPGGAGAPVELLEGLRAGAMEVLRAAADQGRGPWALLEGA